MRHRILVAAVVSAFVFCPISSFAKCACENKTSVDSLNQQAMNAAFKLPSEADRSLARNFRLQGLPVDAAEWYRSASLKASSEIADARAKMSQSPPAVTASDLEQISLHSTSVLREAASFFSQRGDASSAARNWEQAIEAELAVRKPNADLANEYGTVARLFEQSGNRAKAAEMFKKQGDQLAATQGRYSPDTQFAYAEFNRLYRQHASPLRSASR